MYTFSELTKAVTGSGFCRRGADAVVPAFVFKMAGIVGARLATWNGKGGTVIFYPAIVLRGVGLIFALSCK